MKAWQFTRRRGRPRLERNGNMIDRGTPEARARRAALVGGADPTLSEHPLGVLLARGLIGPEMHAAACTYAWLYARAVGRPRMSCAPLYRRLAGDPAGPGPAPLDEAAEAAIEERFRRGKNRLLAAGRRVCDATENVVVFGRFPRFLDSAGRRPAAAHRADAMELAALRTGLEVLAACYGQGRRPGRPAGDASPAQPQARGRR